MLECEQETLQQKQTCRCLCTNPRMCTGKWYEDHLQKVKSRSHCRNDQAGTQLLVIVLKKTSVVNGRQTMVIRWTKKHWLTAPWVLAWAWALVWLRARALCVSVRVCLCMCVDAIATVLVPRHKFLAWLNIARCNVFRSTTSSFWPLASPCKEKATQGVCILKVESLDSKNADVPASR